MKTKLLGLLLLVGLFIPLQGCQFPQINAPGETVEQEEGDDDDDDDDDDQEQEEDN